MVKNSSKDFNVINKGIKSSFDKVKEEFNLHLDSINDNTNEIHSNHEYISDVDSKIDKLNEKLDEIMMFLQHITNKSFKKDVSFKISPLTRKEQEIFLAIYTLEQGNEPVTYHSIAEFLSLPVLLVQGYITNLLEKGIPVQKSFVNNSVFLRLNPLFRKLQTKENLVKIHSSVSKKFSQVND